MGKIMRNGIEYGAGSSSIYSQAGTATRAICDEEWNRIDETYYLKSDLQEKAAGAGSFTQTEAETMKNANFHNSFYRGNDITSKFNDGSLYTAISEGTFEDLFIGDYFIATINGNEITCRIAGFNIYWNSYGTFKTNHAVIVPDERLMSAAMEDSNTTANGYKGSKMHVTNMATINGYLSSVFGSHLLTHKEYFSSALNATAKPMGYTGWAGAASSWAADDSIADLMSEVEVYGTCVLSSSGFDPVNGRSQLPLFALAPELICTRFAWWLRSVVNSTHFACVGASGSAHYSVAGDSYGVRPRWLIG